MLPTEPSYAITAGPLKLKHVTDLVKKRLFGGRERSDHMGKG